MFATEPSASSRNPSTRCVSRLRISSPDAANRVLIVEDDEQISHALKALLEAEGYLVTTAADGAAGIDLARALRPDVVVMDLVLPEINGLDAATLLKADEATARIPLIAVTASWLGSDGERLRRAGFEGALRKPFPPEALAKELSRLLTA
jgi:CheY-like chemotaxis protein